MRMYKKIIALAVILIGMTGWAGDSAPFLLDTTDPLITAPFTYNSSWIGGDPSAEVVIVADGTEIKRTTGEGEFIWSPATVGKHTLTYTAYINGIAQKEVYTATVYADWKYTVEDSKATIVETTQKSGNVMIPSEIDGYSVFGFDTTVFANCTNLTSITIPDSVYNLGANAFANCTGLTKVSMPFPLKAQVESGNVFVGCSDALEIVYRTVEIKNVVAKQRYPWNGKIDIKFEVIGNVNAGISSENPAELIVSAKDSVTGEEWSAKTLTGDTGTDEGGHHVIWDMKADGLSFYSQNIKFKVGYFTKPRKYCVIDLSAGKDATGYPVSYLADVPEGGWTDEYKTTKLVLRLIEPGSFKMGGSYDVTLTKPYYMGVFEVTQKQYELVTGSKPSMRSGNTLPVEQVSWNMIRGNSSTHNWPTVKTVDSNSFVGRLQARTGLSFDLPTEAQWEYACRAGTTTIYYWGDSMDGAYAWYSSNSSSTTHVVGTRTPNAWGLYDMSGNVREWCLDWYAGLSSSENHEGPLSGSYRVGHGGGWNSSASACTSAFRIDIDPSSVNSIHGFRVAGQSLRNRIVDVFYEGESSSIFVDTYSEPLFEMGVDKLSYNSSWVGGDSSAEVVISDNGTEIKRTIGEGDFTWAATPGKHTLTYTTYIDGVAQEEVYTATVFKDWKYTVSDGKATIVETTQKSGSVTIPSEIDGLSVVGFVDGLFDGCTNLTQVVIPGNCVAKMSDIFPDSYDKLTSVTLTGDVTEIPQNAFAGCVALESFIIPDSVTKIGANAFAGCALLENVEISESVMDIGTGAFSGCAAMADDDGYLVIRGVLYGYFGDDSCIDLSDGVTGVDSKAFYGYDTLTSITMPLTILEGNMEQAPQVEKNNWIEGEDGVYQSNDINDSESTSMTLEVKGPLDFTFDWKVSSEGNCDKLKWYLNGSQISVISGIGSGWQTVNYSIPEGSHTIRWEYTKDGSVSNGDDCGWVRFTEFISTTVTMANLFPDSYVAITNVVLTGQGEKIPAGAFAGCASLQNVVIPDGVTTIGVRAFEGCEALSEITIPDGVTKIGENAFSGCSALMEIVIPDSADKIGENVFKDCTNLKSITIRLAVEGAAENLPNDVPLTLILDNNDQRIPDRLRNCVQKVIFSDGITQIADDFFLDCNNLETIDIPQSVVAIGRNVFNFCSSLNIVTQDGFKLYQGWCLGYEGADNLTLKIPEGVLGIAADAFKGMTSLKSVTFPSSLRFIGADAFAGCTQLAELALTDGIVEIADGAFRDCTWVQKVKMPSTLERIGAAAFANCAYLPNIVCADGLEEIGVGAFSNCWRMTSVSLPASLDSVGCDAFWNCKNLGGVTVPAHVQPLAEMLSAAYSALSSIIIAEGETELCEGAFEGCAGVTKIDIPEVITNIPARAFKNCTNFDRLVLPSGLLAIGDEAFYGCSKIESLTLPKNLTSIGAGAFNGWALLDVVTIPDGVTFIGSGAFAGCAAVRQVRMPSNVATVSATFPDAYTEIVRVMIPNNSTGIIAGFLNGCISITSFDIPLSVTEIGDNAFRGCKNLSGISLPDGLDKIGSYAFYGCTLINDLTIPSSVTAIGYNAFGSCAQIRSVVISGEAGTLSSLFPNAYQQIVSVTVLPGSEKLMNRIFAGCKSLKNVDIPTSVTEIGEGAFEGCTALTSAGIPAGVTVLGKGAFRGCSTLTEITLPNGLSVLEDEVFSGCSLLSAITIPESVGEIGSKVFNGCSALHSVKFVGNAPLADVESYTGVSSSLVTYVPYASMGWDGIFTSMALPEFWPVGYENTIEWWDPIRFDVTFDWNCEAGEVDVIEQVVDTTYLLPDVDPTREGATFVGWWTAKMDGARITPASRVMLTTPHTLYAHWRMNTYSVVFDANGGTGAMEPMDLTVNKPAVLTACGFTRFDSDFAGWAIELEGEVLYRDCAEVSNLTLENDAVVTLYAVWTPRTWTEGDYLNQPGLVFASEGDAPWVTDAEVSHDGIASLRSGAIGASAEYPDRTCSTIKTTVVGEGTGSFWWKVHCEEMDAEYGDWFDYAVFTVDGVEVAKIAGDNDWRKVAYSVTGAGEHELVWTFTRDNYDLEDSEWLNAAWLDELVWSPKTVALKFDAGGATGDVPESILRQEGDTVLLPGAGTLVKGTDIFKGWSDGTTLYISGSEYTFGSEDETLTAVWEEKVWTLAEAADAVALVMTTGGTADWTVDATTGYTNMVCVKSGVVTSGQESWIETKVNGSGKLTFRWNVMGGVYRNQPFAYAKVEVDGVEFGSEYLTDDWEEVVYEITGVEEHTIRWTYLRTSTRAADGDCAWIDAVVWTPASSSDITVDMGNGKSVVVPMEWIDKYDSIVTAAGGDKAAALQRTAANGRKVWECFMLGVDPTKADDDFKITRFWMEGGKPMFEFSHSTDGAGNSFTPRLKVKGKAKLSDGWSDVPEGGNSAFRFFTVVVELP